MNIEFRGPRFIDVQGNLIDVGEIESLRHWPATKWEPEHRVNLATKRGQVWELYRGTSQQDAEAVRDQTRKQITEALQPPVPVQSGSR